MDVIFSSIALLALTVAIGFGYKYGGAKTLGVTPEVIELEKVLGVEASSTGAKIILFTAEFCSKCPQLRRNLKAENINFAEVDITNRLDLASKLEINQTPTIFVLDSSGRLNHRLTGAITVSQIKQLDKDLTDAKN
jgi:glutaredoxin